MSYAPSGRNRRRRRRRRRHYDINITRETII
jgi:hypothetical protein